MSQPETRMVAVDGTDALACVILRPGSNASGVVIEAAVKGISKPYAAYALRHTAQSWDPDDTVGADVGEQLKEALADVERLTARLERTSEQQADILIDCATCSQPAHWIDSPTGGWWSHEVHPEDRHDAAAVEIDLINEIQLLRAENGQLRTELADTAMMRDFNQRSAEHIAAKRDLAEAAIAAWDRDEISGDAAVLMIRKALAEEPPTPACTCRAEAVHQAGCEAGQHA